MKSDRRENRRLRVLMVEHHSPGNRYVLELARELKNECDLTIFCNLHADFQEEGIRWIRRFYDGGRGKAGAVADYGRTLAELALLIGAGGFDVLHIQSFKKASAEMQLYLRLRRCYKKLVMTVHNVLPHEPAPGDQELYGRFYRACDLLIVHNEASRAELTEKFSIPAEKVAVIPRGLYTTYSADPGVRREDGRICFLNFGRIRPYKGVDILLKAVSLMDKKDREKCRFVIRGEQYPKLDPTDYAALIRRYGIEDCVEFSNTRVPEEEIPSLIGNADFLLFPYRKIYGSGVLLMAYTYGVPVVASDVPTFVEGTDGGKAGILFESENPAAMKDALLQAMATTPARREAYRAEIRRICEERHSWKVTAARTVGAFRALLDPGSDMPGAAPDITAVEAFVRGCADARLEEFTALGHAAAGRNGPYDYRDTPVRNTAHWLITYSYLWKTTGDARYEAVCRRFGKYLLDEQAKSASGAVRCIDDPRADSINGVIGQAWIIEALVYAFEVFRDEAYLDCAVSVFHSQHFDPLTGFWKRVDPDGRELGYDYTLNHQVWFCLAGLLILRHRRDEEIRRQVSHFLRRVRREYFGVHPDGLIRHYGRMTRFRRPFAALYAKQYVKYAGLRLGVFDPKKVDLLTQEEGYQLFELFGYALIARLRPDDPLFRTKAFRKALALGTDTDRMNERLGVGDPETMNPYAYGYNSPAFEEPLVELLFTGRADAGKTLSLLELQKRLCYDPETRRLDRNTRDPETLAARLYEYVHFCDCCRGDR